MNSSRSSASSACSTAGTRAMNSSTSGRSPAFQASMNSLRTCSRVVLIQDLLQFAQAARAALVGIFRRDLQSLGDLGSWQLLVVGQLQNLAVFVVLDLADCPQHQAFFALLFQVAVNPLGRLLVARRFPRGGGAGVPAGIGGRGEPLVDTSGRPLRVTELLATEVAAAVLHTV